MLMLMLVLVEGPARQTWPWFQKPMSLSLAPQL
jgi:hypothetical protein